ncbi:MAG: hypothetical protein WA029_04045, partial [Anaerolineae bacterium]
VGVQVISGWNAPAARIHSAAVIGAGCLSGYVFFKNESANPREENNLSGLFHANTTVRSDSA